MNMSMGYGLPQYGAPQYGLTSAAYPQQQMYQQQPQQYAQQPYQMVMSGYGGSYGAGSPYGSAMNPGFGTNLGGYQGGSYGGVPIFNTALGQTGRPSGINIASQPAVPTSFPSPYLHPSWNFMPAASQQYVNSLIAITGGVGVNIDINPNQMPYNGAISSTSVSPLTFGGQGQYFAPPMGYMSPTGYY